MNEIFLNELAQTMSMAIDLLDANDVPRARLLLGLSLDGIHAAKNPVDLLRLDRDLAATDEPVKAAA